MRERTLKALEIVRLATEPGAYDRPFFLSRCCLALDAMPQLRLEQSLPRLRFTLQPHRLASCYLFKPTLRQRFASFIFHKALVGLPEKSGSLSRPDYAP